MEFVLPYDHEEEKEKTVQGSVVSASSCLSRYI